VAPDTPPGTPTRRMPELEVDGTQGVEVGSVTGIPTSAALGSPVEAATAGMLGAGGTRGDVVPAVLPSDSGAGGTTSGAGGTAAGGTEAEVEASHMAMEDANVGAEEMGQPAAPGAAQQQEAAKDLPTPSEPVEVSHMAMEDANVGAQEMSEASSGVTSGTAGASESSSGGGHHTRPPKPIGIGGVAAGHIPGGGRTHDTTSRSTAGASGTYWV
jgi:hypothetical protein